jgi:hypothetical protein
MPLKVIGEGDIGPLIGHLMASYEVVGALPKEKRFAFGVLHAADEAVVGHPISILPPKVPLPTKGGAASLQHKDRSPGAACG